MEADKNPDIAEAMRELEKISRDETKKAEYDARLKAIRDYRFYLKMSEQRGFEAGKMEGRTEEREEGIIALVETCRELGECRDKTVRRLQDKYGLSQETAENYMEKY